MTVCLDPENWGWKLNDGKLVPIMTDLQPAPAEVPSVISCRCKVTTKKPCSTQLCDCRKHRLHCVAACKHCCGENCENVSQLTLADVDNEDDEDDDIDGDEVAVIEELGVFDDAVSGWIDEEVVDSTVYMD